MSLYESMIVMETYTMILLVIYFPQNDFISIIIHVVLKCSETKMIVVYAIKVNYNGEI